MEVRGRGAFELRKLASFFVEGESLRVASFVSSQQRGNDLGISNSIFCLVSGIFLPAENML